jgi:hypothetical protein
MRILTEIIETDNAEILQVLVAQKFVNLQASCMLSCCSGLYFELTLLAINGMNIIDFALHRKSRNVLTALVKKELLGFDYLSNKCLIKADAEMFAFLRELGMFHRFGVMN